jgi:hypothetical protein
LPHGELAHFDGFMIADGIALKKLFELPNHPREIDPREAYRGRLFAFDIRKSELNMSDRSLSACLNYIKKRSAEEIRAARNAASNGSPSYSDGTHHALHMIQFVNAHLAAAKVITAATPGESV